MQLHRLLTGGPSELAFQTFPPVKDHPWLYIFHDLSLDNNNLLRKRHPVKRCFLWIVVQIKGFVLVLHEDSKCHEFRKLLTKPWYVCLGLISYYETPIWPKRGWAGGKLVFESISPMQWMSGRCSPFARWSQSTSSTSTPRLSTPPAPSKPPPSLTICTRSLYSVAQVWEGAVQAWGSLVVRSLSSSPGKMLCLPRCCQGTLCLVSGEV